VLIYLDTSALTKLVVEEDETPDLRAWISRRSGQRLVSNALIRTELRRAVLRFADRSDVPRDQARLIARRAAALLGQIDQIRLSPPLLDQAGWQPPTQLRSLDAIHLATAASLGPDLRTLVVYDRRLSDAAEDLGIAVAAPGRNP